MPTRSAPGADRSRRSLTYYAKRIGPGLITGAANDDPGAIGTHSQVGAQFGYAPLWLAPYTFPLTAVVLEMCAQIGNVAGQGLATTLRWHYPRWVLYGAVLLLIVANVINLAADLGIMAAAVQMLLGRSAVLWLIVLAAGCAVLEVFMPYDKYARVLKVVTLSLFAYVVTLFVIPLDWGTVLRRTFIPTIQLDSAFLTAVVAVLGTRLSPYALFWQPAQVVEEQIDEGKERLEERIGATRREVRAMQVDVTTGAFVANLVTWAIMVTTAATLHAQGITDVTTATQAADALRPAAGNFAYVLFAFGILGTGLLAVPVLAGGIAYAVGDALGWERGLSRRVRHAPRFYAVIAASIAVAVLLNFAGVNPIRALVLSQIVNGLVAIPLVFLILRICNNPAVMGDKTNGRLANTLGVATLVLITAAGVAVVWNVVR